MILTEINDFLDYIMELFSKQDEYIVFITSSDAHVPRNRKNPKLKILRSLGVQTDLQQTYRHSFLAIIDGGETIVEKSHENKAITAEYMFSRHKAEILSQGFNAAPGRNSPVSIVIDGFDYAVNSRGLNFVVWNIKEEKVVDSVAFDTFFNDEITRKPIGFDYEVLYKTYDLLLEMSEINSGFVRRYYENVKKNIINVKDVYDYLRVNGIFLSKIGALINNGIPVLAFEQTHVSKMTNPTEWEKICMTNNGNC